jgi:hypothetical protein
LSGGFFTFASAQLQSQRQADTEVLAEKRKDFATFLTDVFDLNLEQIGVADAFYYFQLNKDRRAVDSALQRYNDVGRRESHSNSIVSLYDSPSSNGLRVALDDNGSAFAIDVLSAKHALDAGKPVTDEQISAMRQKVEKQVHLVSDYTHAARNDLKLPHRGLLDVFG